ncbi:hypothetical protein KVR01_007427 [Diaporthe batatas]|uniref:uncharacterized protein n=1 Tax=Diaporthe batatas TaxID=748121 RepID=UPI001D04DF2A|nr:uncharacterized protein KVR01_007427 [Diaporthe batatas]KAG8162949.1 hypothetical protein KVR01_007427 [Diaporthe batatas]
MGVPALLVDFPPKSSPEYAARVRHLGRQWPVFWAVGHGFFKPISTLGLLGYSYTLWAAQGRGGGFGDWRLYALSALCHLVTMVHSAVNMQPLNNKLDGLASAKASKSDVDQAESFARSWMRWNTVRIAMPLIAGTSALWQLVASH